MSFGIEPWPSLDSVLASGTGTARYLEVTVRSIGVAGSDVTMAPRLVLPSQPYAFLARHARTAQVLTGQDGNAVLSVGGTAVGVGIGNRLPAATLEVGGKITVGSLSSQGTISVNGTYAAQSFSGDGTIPIGGIVVWSGRNTPPGWAMCDGRTVNGRQTPNLQSRFVLGNGPSYPMGTTGGSERHVLAERHLPRHSHFFDPPATTTTSGGSHSHRYQTHIIGPPGAWAAGGDRYTTDPNESRTSGVERAMNHGSHDHSGTLGISGTSTVSGSSQSHNGMPPFYVLAYIMRVQ